MEFKNISYPDQIPNDGDTIEFKIGDQLIHDSYDFNLLRRILDMIPQDTIDVISKTQFRDLFTFNEQVVIDNAVNSGTLSPEQIAIFNSIQKSFSDADNISLSNPKVIMGIRFFADTPIGTIPGCGLITATRAEQILQRNYGV